VVTANDTPEKIALKDLLKVIGCTCCTDNLHFHASRDQFKNINIKTANRFTIPGLLKEVLIFNQACSRFG
jgi:hypothetical protein